MPTQPNPIKEAQRYLSNARTLLSEKAGKDGNYYTDKKYVKLAGHAAWCGVLVALDAVFDVKSKLKKDQRPDIKDYHEAVAKRDKKMHHVLLAAYDGLHKSMGYDGYTNYKAAQASLSTGKEVIAWCEKIYQPKT